MKYHYLYLVKKDSTAEEALFELYPLLSDIYEMEESETGSVQIGGYSERADLPSTLEHSTLEARSSAHELDWQKQWAHFAPDFHEGSAHINLKAHGTLQLKPGGGFGDFSHPTTRLVLELMPSTVKDKTVFDIGCGSGILSLAALLLGAKQTYGIDIDESATLHSQENAKLNGLETKAIFSKEINPSWIPNEPFVVLMNMIESEQKVAWDSLENNIRTKPKKFTAITSGILATQRDRYLELTKSWGWTLLEEKGEEDWIGFIFESPQ